MIVVVIIIILSSSTSEHHTPLTASGPRSRSEALGARRRCRRPCADSRPAPIYASTLPALSTTRHQLGCNLGLILVHREHHHHRHHSDLQGSFAFSDLRIASPSSSWASASDRPERRAWREPTRWSRAPWRKAARSWRVSGAVITLPTTQTCQRRDQTHHNCAVADQQRTRSRMRRAMAV
eukprot:1867680-Rhodomonas_salina.1